MTDFYTQAQLDDMGKNLPPKGHPHYLPIEERLGLVKDELGLYRKIVVKTEEKPVSTSAAATKYQELKAKIAAAKAEMEATAKTAFTDMAKEFFDANPTVLAFGWTQYTPYWNDGDVCTFRAQTDYPTVTMLVDGQALTYNENSGEITDNDGDEIRTADHYKRMFENIRSAEIASITTGGVTVTFDPATKSITIDGQPVKTQSEYSKMFDSATSSVSEFLGHFEDADLETMFGDHVEIMVAKDGTIETEEHEHE